MPVVLLVFGLLVALLTLPGLIPVRSWAILFPAFFASFLGAGLSGWWLALVPVLTVVLVVLGGLASWAGWVGLALVVVAMAALAYEALLARKAAHRVRPRARRARADARGAVAVRDRSCSPSRCATPTSSAPRTSATRTARAGVTCSTCTARVCRARRRAR